MFRFPYAGRRLAGHAVSACDQNRGSRVNPAGYRAATILLLMLTAVRAGTLDADSLLTALLEGNNGKPGWNLTMETVALATPVVEFGWVLSQRYIGKNGIDPYSRESSRLTAGSLLLTQGVVGVLKYTFQRERPARSYQPRLWNTRLTPSFPSGHTASSAAFATVAAYRYPELAPVLTLYALVSAFSQVYVGNHYVGDVIGGAVVGAAIGTWVHSQSLIKGDPAPGRAPLMLVFQIPL